jgi:hypothetical protein
MKSVIWRCGNTPRGDRARCGRALTKPIEFALLRSKIDTRLGQST